MFGVAGSVLAILYLYRFEGFSRSVFALDAAFLAFLLIGARVAITSVDDYLRRQRQRGDRVLIYGAGRGGTRPAARAARKSAPTTSRRSASSTTTPPGAACASKGSKFSGRSKICRR